MKTLNSLFWGIIVFVGILLPIESNALIPPELYLCNSASNAYGGSTYNINIQVGQAFSVYMYFNPEGYQYPHTYSSRVSIGGPMPFLQYINYYPSWTQFSSAGYYLVATITPTNTGYSFPEVYVQTYMDGQEQTGLEPIVYFQFNISPATGNISVVNGG